MTHPVRIAPDGPDLGDRPGPGRDGCRTYLVSETVLNSSAVRGLGTTPSTFFVVTRAGGACQIGTAGSHLAARSRLTCSNAAFLAAWSTVASALPMAVNISVIDWSPNSALPRPKNVPTKLPGSL